MRKAARLFNESHHVLWFAKTASDSQIRNSRIENEDMKFRSGFSRFGFLDTLIVTTVIQERYSKTVIGACGTLSPVANIDTARNQCAYRTQLTSGAPSMTKS